MKRASISLLGLLIPLVLIAACSGDTSFNGDNGNPPPPAGIAITPTNGMQVAQVAYQSVVTSGEIGGLSGSTGLTADAGGAFAKPAMQNRLAGTLGSLVQQIPFGPTMLMCAVDGSLTISGNLSDPATFTAGDTILAVYDICDDGFGEVIDGTLDSVIDAFDGDILSGVYALTMTMDLIDFTSTTATDMLMANGDGTATLDTSAAPYVEVSVSGNLMVTNTNTTSESLTSYSSVQTLDAGLNPAPYTVMASGTLDSSTLSGAITYSTPVMFAGFDADYPSAGELLVSGESGSARLIAVDNVNVRIEIYSSSDGTGTPDDTINTTWADLAAM